MNWTITTHSASYVGVAAFFNADGITLVYNGSLSFVQWQDVVTIQPPGGPVFRVPGVGQGV